MNKKELIYQVLACSEPTNTNPTTQDTEVQKFVVAQIVELNNDPELAKFKNLIIGSKPFNLTFFEDQGIFYENVQKKDADGKPDAHIIGNLITRRTRPYYVIDKKTGKSYTYQKNGKLKGLPVVATNVKFFLHKGQDEEAEFSRVMQQNADNLVPAGELELYIDALGLNREELKKQGIDVDNTSSSSKSADILTGDEKPDAPVAGQSTERPLSQPNPPAGQTAGG